MARRPPQAEDAPGVPARRAALRLLDAVLRRGQALEAALDSAARGLAPSDRGLAHAIAAETLRRLADLDALIDSATARPLPDDAKARFALRIALVQALALGTPPHAAIATALPLVEGGPRKLVHGVFGTLFRGHAALPEIPQLPAAAALRWEAAWGDDLVEAAERAIAVPPPLDLSLRAPSDEAAARIGGVSLAPGHVRVASDAVVTELPGYAEGEWWVQDFAASLPARLIGTGTGTALDLCAAPGGKTLQLAAAGWQVTAVDISESRLARLRENLGRVGFEAEVIAADLMNWAPAASADAVLLDAPCSATGIFRRHPDVLHRVRASHIAETAALQARLLDRAAAWVKPGGMLVYATCSLEPEEGERQLERFVDAHREFALAPIDDEELPMGISPHPHGWLRTTPDMLADQGALDGFFIARLTRAN